MKSFRGKKALVTGAASGIGRALALALAKEGADLYLIDVDDANVQATAHDARTCGVEAITRHCDLTDPAQIAATVDAVLAHWGALNILINNAGISDRRKTHEVSDTEWDRMLAINLSAPIMLTRKLLPTLLANEAHVLNVCSIFGLVGTHKAAAYQTSKFGLVGFTSALRAEYGSPQFGVTALCPGFVRTPMMDRLNAMLARRAPPAWIFTTPETVAARALVGIGRDRGIVVVTPFARIYWLLGRLFPGLIDIVYRRPWRQRKKRAAVARELQQTIAHTTDAAPRRGHIT
jgi:NAD(P)-dependent dehydrogenase (short-subunit alcohol dehydrogenase family)